MTLFLLLLLPLAPAAAAGAADRGGVQAIVASGHRGAVLALDYDASRKLLFSAGADGTVRIWNGRTLIKTITVTNLRAGMIAVDPAEPVFAVLETDGIHTFSLDEWDWEKDARLFHIPLDDAPLFISYFASGRSLLYSLPRWKSLQIVDAERGAAVPLQSEGNGIVGLAALSRSEKVLMTYRLTGALSFWELASGRLLEERDVLPQLSHLTISHDLGFLVGSTGSELVRINIASGAVEARVGMSAVTSLDISPADDSVACIAQGATVRWSFASGTLTRVTDPLASPPSETVVRFGPDALYAGARDGGITAYADSGAAVAFGPDARAIITGSAARGDMLALASRDWVHVFVSGLAGAALSGSTGSEALRTFQIDNPFKAPVGLLFLDDSSLLVYRNADGPGDYRVLDLATRAFRPSPPSLPSPIIDAQSSDGRCLLLSQDGTLRVLDLPAGSTRGEMLRPGTTSATMAAPNTVIVGGDGGVVAQGSLVKINLSTGETDPLPTRNQYTYDVAYDERSGTLYSLGVDAQGTTNLVAHAGGDLQKEALVDSSSGEHLFASIDLDPADGSLYTTLGRDQIVQWRNGSMKKLAAPARAALALLNGSRLLYAVNRDSSVSLASASSGAPCAELSLFKDGGWALLFPDGRFAASPGAETFVTVLQNGQPVQNKSSFIVPIQVADSR